MKQFDLEIITPDNVVFKGKISSLMVPAQKGYMGIMAGHASFIGSLKAGKITLDDQAETAGVKTKPQTSFSVKEGFFEILSPPFGTTKVTILAESVTA